MSKPPTKAFLNSLETAKANYDKAKNSLSRERLKSSSVGADKVDASKDFAVQERDFDRLLNPVMGTPLEGEIRKKYALDTPLPAFTQVNFIHEATGIKTSMAVSDTSPRMGTILQEASHVTKELTDLVDKASSMFETKSLGNRLVASTNDPEARHMQSAPMVEYAEWINVLHDWLTGEFVMQTPHRAAHKGLEALGLQIAHYKDNKPVAHYPLKDHPDPIHILAVEHDWARLFHGAKLDGPDPDKGVGEWRLPYDVQVFEFAISGAAVIACCFQQEHKATLTFAVRAPGQKAWATDQAAVAFDSNNWQYITGRDLIGQGTEKINKGFDRLYTFLFSQIRAVTIMLEAEVVEVEATRAPYKTNKPDKDRVALPMYSHHVVRLHRRQRASRLPVASGHVPGHHVRLHFRRGHWRHYTQHKTWIKWMLVGDPDLGFVDKEYRT